MKYRRRQTKISRYISRTQKEKVKKRNKRIFVMFVNTVALIAVLMFAGRVININPTGKIYKLADRGAKYLKSGGEKIAEFSFSYLRDDKSDKTSALADEAKKAMASDALSEKNSDAAEPLIFNASMPCEGKVSSGFGMRIHPIDKISSMHNGIDIAADEGCPVYACAPGKVIFSGYNEFSGNHVKIDHGGGFVSSYSHMAKTNVKSGDYISGTLALGAVGSTGAATGPHLHFEILLNEVAVNPLDYISGDFN